MIFIYLSPHNSVAAVKILSVHVHRAALASHTAGRPAGQFSQNAQNRDAHDICEPVGTV